MVEEKLVNFQLDKDVYKELKLLSVRENRSIKEILKEQIVEYVKVHKEGNPQHLITKFTENEDFTGFPAMGISLDNKKSYTQKHLIKEDRLTPLGKKAWGHVCEWYNILRKG